MRRDRPVRVVVVEDEPLFGSLLCVALTQDAALEVVGAFADGSNAVGAVPKLVPDVALLDLDLGAGPDGLQTGLLLRREMPSIGLVLLSNYSCPRLLTALPPEDAHGWSYLLKRSVADVDALRRAVHGAARGRVTLDPALVAARFPQAGGRLARLTERQRSLVELLAMGWSNARIARHLSLSPRSVDHQLSRVYSAFGLDRQTDAINPRVRAVLAYLEETYEAAANSA